jgi:hypothetical protein
MVVLRFVVTGAPPSSTLYHRILVDPALAVAESTAFVLIQALAEVTEVMEGVVIT